MKRALFLFVAMIILSSALFFLLIRLFGSDTNILVHSMCLLIILSGPSIVCIKGLSRLRYLEKTDSRKPSFKIAESSCISEDPRINFDSLKHKISGKWIITFSDENEKVIKFRYKMTFKSYSSGAWLKFNEGEDGVYIEYFSLGMTDIFKLRKMREEVEQYIMSTSP